MTDWARGIIEFDHQPSLETLAVEQVAAVLDTDQLFTTVVGLLANDAVGLTICLARQAAFAFALTRTLEDDRVCLFHQLLALDQFLFIGEVLLITQILNVQCQTELVGQVRIKSFDLASPNNAG